VLEKTSTADLSKNWMKNADVITQFFYEQATGKKLVMYVKIGGLDSCLHPLLVLF
jgi:hypothetical protein